MNFTKIQTTNSEKQPNGWIMPFYKKNDPNFAEYDLRFIYASAVAPNTTKGPHVHYKRECRLVPISGRLLITTRVDGNYVRREIDSAKPEVIIIKAGTPFCLENKDEKEAIVINLANHIWMPDDQDNHKVDDWAV